MKTKHKNPAYGGRYFTPEEAENIAVEMLVMSQVHAMSPEEKRYVAVVLPSLIKSFRESMTSEPLGQGYSSPLPSPEG